MVEDMEAEDMDVVPGLMQPLGERFRLGVVVLQQCNSHFACLATTNLLQQSRHVTPIPPSPKGGGERPNLPSRPRLFTMRAIYPIGMTW